VNVRGVDYTVTSSVSWVTDQGGPVSCSNNSKTAANLRILSEVSSPATKGTVDEVGLVTPPPGTFSPGQGRAIVKVNDRNGTGIVGASVSLIGTTTYTATTNSLGCAVFPFVNGANYTASVGGLSLVDWQGVSPSTKAMTVTAGTSTSTSFEMDTSAEIRAAFDTVVAGTTAVAAKSQWLTLTNSKLSVGAKIFQGSPAGLPQSTVIAPTLFPFVDGYKAYAGQCTANNPALAPTNNAGLLPTYSLTPGQILTMTSANDIRVPSINVQVIKASDGSAFNGATVKITSADSGCTQTFPTQVTQAKTYGSTTYQGVLPEPGFPYGNYRLCGQATISGTPQHGYADRRVAGAWSDNGTTLLNEATNPAVNEVVPNTSAGGTQASMSTDGAVRIRMTRQGLCP
jgi:hypothetical protein